MQFNLFQSDNKINGRKCFTCQKSLTSSLLTYEKENTRMYLAEKTDILPLGKDAENPPKKTLKHYVMSKVLDPFMVRSYDQTPTQSMSK